MSGNADALKLLFPIPLGPTFETALTCDALNLDRTQASADQLLAEIFPDGAYNLLPDWERVCGITPAIGDVVQLRCDRVISKLRELGDIKAPWFIKLAATMGFTITITHLTPFMSGWNTAGDPLYVEDVWWVWQIHVTGTPVYNFRSGQALASERLSWWPAATALEDLFNDLKPADVYLQFVYA